MSGYQNFYLRVYLVRKSKLIVVTSNSISTIFLSNNLSDTGLLPTFLIWNDHCSALCGKVKLPLPGWKFQHKGRVPLPNQMNFWKKSKRPLTPAPSFLENYVAIFLQCNGYGHIYAKRHRPDSIN